MTTTCFPELHWFEGQFLRQHHMQALTSQLHSELAMRSSQLAPYRYGVVQIGFDAAQFEAGMLHLQELDLVLKGGSRLRLPGNSEIPSRPFREELERAGGRLEVRIGVPAPQPKFPSVAYNGEAGRRYRVFEDELFDENTGDDKEVVMRRMLQARLFVGKEEDPGYEMIKVAEIHEDGDRQPAPSWDSRYIPPLMILAGHAPLKTQLEDLVEALWAALEQVSGEARGDESTSSTEILTRGVLKLFALQSRVPRVEQVCRTPAVHPFDAYQTLCSLAGTLALFGPTGLCPRLPLYDHENLGECFGIVLGILYEQLNFLNRRTWDRVPFQIQERDNLVYEAEVPGHWLQDPWHIYLGVESNIPPAQVDHLVLSLIKACSRSDMTNTRHQIPTGIALTPVKDPPAILGRFPGVRFYRFDRRHTERVHWERLVRSGELSLMLPYPVEEGNRLWLYAANEA